MAILTQHNDNARTGTNLNESILNSANVNVGQFGKLFSHAVQGQIYAQPLFVPFVSIPAKGVHNIVIVATMENWLYAFDADDNLGPNAQPLWSRQIHGQPVPAHVFNPNYFDIAGSAGGNIGILGTPVIEANLGTSAANPTTGTLYLVMATWDPGLFKAQPEKSFKQLLYAINLNDGKPRPAAPGQTNPVEIGGSFPGAGYAQGQQSD